MRRCGWFSTALPGILLVLVAGCAGFRKGLEPEDVPSMAEQRPAVVVLVPGRNIRLSESILKVYGFQNQVRHYSINGIWDPAPAMESAMVDVLSARLGCRATPLRASMSPQAFVQLVSRREREIYGRTEDDALGRPLEGAYSPQELPGLDYLVELTIGKFVVGGGTLQRNTLGVFLCGRLIRLSDGVVLWRDRTIVGVRIEGMETFADLEKNDLALLKAHFSKLVDEVLGPDSSFLAGLRTR
jgi:hypothetical protein